MAIDKFFIAPLDSGLTLDKKPFAIMDTAFTELRNAYSWRGRIVKRFGSELSGNAIGQGITSSITFAMYSKGAIDLSAFPATLGYGIGETDATGGFDGYFPNFLGSLAAIAPAVTIYNAKGFVVGQYFSIGAYTYTIAALGTPAALTASGGTGVGTLDTTTGELIFTTALKGETITFYPYVGYPYSGITDGAGIVAGVVPGNKWKVGQQFSIGDVVFTVVLTGVDQPMLRSDGSLDVATFDTTTGIYKITIAAYKQTKVYYCPNDPIMGFAQYEVVPVTDEPVYAFDTQFAYKFNGYRWLYTGPGPATCFHGTDAQFFWSCSYQGIIPGSTIMFVTNFNAIYDGGPTITDDPMWYWDNKQWNIFAPISIPGTLGVGGSQKTIVQAKIIIPYKNHLLLMDTIEQMGGQIAGINTRYESRCRFSWLGSPIGISPNPLGFPWYESGQIGYSGGGWVDAGTQEVINSSEYIKDRLVMGFERSTWELAYTNNETEPFQWNKLNTELGCESPYATVPFDKQILTIGTYGITACNGQNVERIDNEIPDYVFGINNNSAGTFRVQGIRDYKTEMVYWSLPIEDKTAWSYFPNTVLVYNYKTGAWAENDDCITAFGYFEQSTDKTWADMTMPWRECNFSWNAYVAMAKDRLILGGNQQGSIFIINPTLTSNARVNMITNFVYNPITRVSTLTIMNHTMFSGDYIKLYDITGITIDPADTGIHKISGMSDANTIFLNDVLVTGGVYLGGGTCSRVSRVSMKTKQWNFYLKEGRNFLVNKIDFLVTRSSGSLKIEQLPNSTNIYLGKDAQNTDTSLGDHPFSISLGAKTGIYMEPDQDRIWRTIFPQADGNFIQLRIFLDEHQMTNAADVFSSIELHAIVLSAKPTSQIMEDFSNVF